MTMTPGQTIGPFFHNGLEWGFEASERLPSAAVLEGQVFDGAGVAMPDAMVEAWIPAAASEAGAGLPGFRRSASTRNTGYHIELPTLPAAGEPAAYITVHGRGLLKHQFTAVFFDNDAGAAILAQVPAERRATLVAQRDAASGVWRWDIHLQGASETVFFDYR